MMESSIVRILGTLVIMVDLFQGSLAVTKCMDGFSKELGSCYSSVYNTTITWTAADNYCRSLGAHLPYMNSYEEGKMLESRSDWTRRLWLGLKINETDNIDSLYWGDSTTVNGSFFDGYSPDEDNRCVVFRKPDKRWELTDCEETYNAICEADFAADVEATSQSPVVTSDSLDDTSRTPATLMTTSSQATNFIETSTEGEFLQCETLECLLDLINEDKETEELLKKGVELSDEILEESSTDPENNPQVDGSEVIEVMQFMDELIPLLLGSFGTNTSVISHRTRNMVIEARTFSGRCGSISTASSNGSPHNIDLCLANEMGGRLGMGLSCVKNVNIIYPFGAKTNESHLSLGSCILTLNVIGEGSASSESENLTVTMTIATRKMDTNNATGSPTCSFWTAATNDSDGYWSDEGCKRAFMNDTHVTCSCDHLTNFAVLVQLAPSTKPLSATDLRILDSLTVAGGIISITCLCLTLTLYACLKVFRNQTIIIHGNLAVSILVSQIIFLTGIDVKNQVACKAVAALLHYFLLSSFSWMMLEGANLYLKATSVFRTTIHMGTLFVIGWVFPLVVVGITLAVKFNSYTSSKSCWLNNENGVIWAFVAPVIFVTVCNTCVLIRVIRVFLSLEALADKSNAKKIKAGARAIVLLTPLLGITWLIGLLNINVVVISYVFVILNSSQGVWIFVLHCVLNEEVGKAFKLKWTKHRKLHSCKVNPNTDSSSKSAVDSLARKSSRKKKIAWATSTSTDKTAVTSSAENK